MKKRSLAILAGGMSLALLLIMRPVQCSDRKPIFCPC